MKSNLRRIFIFAGIAAMILGAVWLKPRVLGLYYQIWGGNLLGRAQSIDSQNNIDLMVCSNSSSDDRNILLILERSLSNLKKAEQLNQMASQTFLSMGRAYCLLGKIPESITSYKKFIQVREKNPVGHLELSFAYESQCERTTNYTSLFNADFPENYCGGDQELRWKILDEWKAAGVTARMFLDAGKEASEKKRYDEALHWYARAGLISPDDGQLWYELGLTFEGMGNWQKALEVYNQGLDRNLNHESGVGSLYYRVGRLYQSNLPGSNQEEAKAAFEKAIEKKDFISGFEEADTHYRLGTIYRREGSNPEKYIKEFKSAIEIFPNHSNAYILLGITYYDLFSDVPLAEQEILLGLKITPSNKWGYLQMGEIYRKEASFEKAEDMYKQALKIDPDYEPAQEALQKLLDEDTQ